MNAEAIRSKHGSFESLGVHLIEVECARRDVVKIALSSKVGAPCLARPEEVSEMSTDLYGALVSDSLVARHR